MAFDDFDDTIGVSPERVVENLIRQQPGFGGDEGPVNPELVLNRLIRKTGATQIAKRQQAQTPQPIEPQDFSEFGRPAGAPQDDFSQFGVPAEPAAAAPPPSSPAQPPDEGTMAALAGGMPSYDPTAPPSAPQPPQEWPGYTKTAGSSFAQHAVTSAGSQLKGVPVGLNAIGEAESLVTPGMAPGTEGTVQGATPFEAVDPRTTAAYRAGEAVQKFGRETFPLSKTQQESITGRAAGGVGSLIGMAPGMVVGGVVGGAPGAIAAGAAQMGLSSAGETFDAAIQKGASVDEAQHAAAASGAAGAVLGALPIGVILKPVEKLLPAFPGLSGWIVDRLAHAAQSGVVFATIGEAQEWLAEQIASGYDPQAGYAKNFDIRRVVASFLTGATAGAVGGAARRQRPEDDLRNRREDEPPSWRPTPGPPHPDEGAPENLGNRQTNPNYNPRRDNFKATLRTLDPSYTDAHLAAMSTDELKAAIKAAHPDTAAGAQPPPEEPKAQPDQGQAAGGQRAESPQEQPQPEAGTAQPPPGTGYAEADARLREAGYSEDAIKGWSPEQRAKRIAELEPEGDGTRESPIELHTPEDLERAASVADEGHTPAQGEANNRQLGHAIWNGIPIAIEARKGGVRRGTVPDTGKPWEATMGAVYGYDRTPGAPAAKDGDKLDLFVLPHLESKTVYVLDELDKNTGKFRQHKAFIGALNPDEAMAAYLGSTGKSRDEIGGMRSFSVEDFKEWKKVAANLKKPVSDAGKKAAQATGKKEEPAATPPEAAGSDIGVQTAREAPASPTSQHTEKPKVSPDTGQNIPETDATLRAQQEQLVKGERQVQMFPKGTQELPLPKGMQRVDTPRGVFHYDPAKIDAEQIKTLSGEGRENDLLGLGPLSKADVAPRMAAGERPAAVVERQQDGTEVRAAAGTEQTAPEQARVMDAAKSPGNTVTIEPPDRVLSERAAPGRIDPEHHDAIETALSNAGVDPQQVAPVDIARAAEIMADEGYAPDDAFQIAAVRGALESGGITPEQVRHLYGEDIAKAILQPKLLRVPDDDRSLREPSERELPVVRGQGREGRAGVQGKGRLSSVHGGDRAATDGAPHDRSQGQRQGVRTGQRPVGHEKGTVGEQGERHPTDMERENADHRNVGEGTRNLGTSALRSSEQGMAGGAHPGATGTEAAAARPSGASQSERTATGHGQPEVEQRVAADEGALTGGAGAALRHGEIENGRATETLLESEFAPQRGVRPEAPSAATGRPAAEAGEGEGAARGRGAGAPLHEGTEGAGAETEPSGPRGARGHEPDTTGEAAGGGAGRDAAGGQRGTGVPETAEAGEAEGRPTRVTQAPKRLIKEPISLLQFIAAQGGLTPTPDLRHIGLNETSRAVAPNQGPRPILRKDGITLDQAIEKMREAGYLPEADPNQPDAAFHDDVIRMLDDELRGNQQHFPAGEARESKHARERTEDESRHLAERDADARLAEMLAEHKIPPETILPEDRRAAVDLMVDHGMSPDDALERAIITNELADGSVEQGAPHFDDLEDIVNETKPEPAQESREVSAAESRQGEPEAEVPAAQEGEQPHGAGETGERITGAAFLYDGKIYSGHNHVQALDAARDAGVPGEDVVSRGKEGFVTSTGRFVDRKEAVEIADAADQWRGPTVGLPRPTAEEIEAMRERGITREALEPLPKGKQVSAATERTPAGEPKPFDEKAFDAREKEIKERASDAQADGKKLVSDLPYGVEALRGIRFRSVRDDATGVILTVTNRGDIDVHWETGQQAGEELRENRRDASEWVVEGKATVTRNKKDEWVVSKPPKIEKTEAGEQAVLPGAEKIGEGEQAQRAAEKPLTPKKGQEPADFGLFGEESKQTDLVDMARKDPAEAWWRDGLSPYGREMVVKAAGLKPSVAKTAWRHIAPDVQEKLAAIRGTDSDPNQHAEATDARARAKTELEERGATRVGNVDYKIVEGPAGFYLTRTENGMRVEEGGAGANRWSRETAIAHAMDDIKGLAGAAAEEHIPTKEKPHGQGDVSKRNAGAEPAGVPEAEPERPTRAAGHAQEPGGEPAVPRDHEGAAEGQAREPAAERGKGGAGEGERPDVGVPAGDERGPGSDERAAGRPDSGVTGENFVIEPGALREDRSPRQKAEANVRALTLAKEIAEAGRPATRAEQAELALYVGWGGLKGAFPDTKGEYGKGFEKTGAALKDLLSADEYKTAQRSIQYAHYTAEPVVRAMWRAAQRFAGEGWYGSVFEPGMGTGNFAGMMPKPAAYSGIEFDATTARIAKLLYPNYGVRHGDFTKTPVPQDSFDLAIGNPPFADIAIKSDPAYKQGFLLHDYFFAKSIDAVRPGGVVAFISSAGTMNKIDPAAREYLADRADLLGAIRLPSDAFKKNAGTEVTTDIVFLRKRLPGEPEGDRSWTQTAEVELPGPDGEPKKGAVNRYFVEHPEMVLGDQGFFDKLYQGRYAVRAKKGADLTEQLDKAIETLPAGVVDPAYKTAESEALDWASEEKKDGTFYLKDGKLHQMVSGAGQVVSRRGAGVSGLTAADFERVTQLIPIRDALRNVYKADLAGDAPAGDAARKLLNQHYDRFVRKYGPINKADLQHRRPNAIQQEGARAEAREEARYLGEPFDEGSFDPTELIKRGATTKEIARARKEARAAAAGRPWSEGSFDPGEMPDVIIDKRPNVDAFMDDPESYRLRAIEKYDEGSGKATKSAVFFENVLKRERAPEIKSVNDAVLHVLNQAGHLDIPEVAKIYGKTESEVVQELGDRIFRDPEAKDTWLMHDDYLSGNVRKKLAIAQAKAARDPEFKRNVEALEAAIPPTIPPQQIHATLGMPWIPPATIETFGKDGLGLESLRVRYIPKLAQWFVSGDVDSVAALQTWGTERRRAPALLQDVLNRQTIRITDAVTMPDGSKTTVVNLEATQAAQDKAAALKEKFASWIWSDPPRAEALTKLYNENYNNLVVREYDGSYLTTPGISSSWKWRPHQTRGIARIILSGNTYLAHAVGAGKTSEMIGAVMEMRRLGLVRKPMIVVPNHMLGQFTKEFYEQYPTAKLAIADELRFHTDRRKQFIANVATDDLDAIIMTHKSFGYIPISDKFADGVVQKELQEYRDLLSQVPKNQDNRVTRSKIEKQIERLEQRLSGRGNKKRDQVFTFEEMGVDHLSVDEAHMFRKLDFATNLNIKGISPEGSQMSWDLYVKSLYLDQQKPNRSLVLASGTPVTNTMAELYTVSRYLQRRELEDRNLDRFDAWAGAFGEPVSELEQDAVGGYKAVSRFARFVNVPELSAIVRQVMDVVTSKQLDQYVTRPTINGGKRQMHLSEKSPALEAYQRTLKERMIRIQQRRGPPKKGDDIMLAVIGDGRHAAIDMRLVHPEMRKDPGSKLSKMVDNVHRIWKETKAHKFYAVKDGAYDLSQPLATGPATQMIFANLGLNREGFNVPDYIRTELVRRGVPREQIAFMKDYKSHTQKQKLFNDMNEGKVRILVGSTAKMATGVNAQRRLYAIHNLDPLWFPSDDEQRNGRGIRQGNWNNEIEIHDYSTKGTYDSTMWGMMARKARFIQGFFEGDKSLRDMDDLGEASQYEQAKAITTNDPRLIKLTELKQDLEKARRREDAWESEHYALVERRRYATNQISAATKEIAETKKDIAQREDTRADKFKGEVQGTTYAKRDDFSDAIRKASFELSIGRNANKNLMVGELGGFPLYVHVHPGGMSGGEPTYWPDLSIRRNGTNRARGVSLDAHQIAQSIENVLRRFETEISSHEAEIAKAKKFLADSDAKVKEEFKGGAETKRLAAEVKKLETEISAPPPEPQPVATDPAIISSLDELFRIGQTATDTIERQPHLAVAMAFGGERAATADLGALATAKEMATAGKSAKEIWRETGWYKRPDGWRFEIDDSQVKFREKDDVIDNPVLTESRNRYGDPEFYFDGRLGDLIDAPPLFHAYPDLADVKVHVGGVEWLSSGKIDPETQAISVSGGGTREGVLDTLIHEIQHAIQMKEGFSSGGNSRTLVARTETALYDLAHQIAALPADSNVRGELEALREELREQAQQFGGGLSGFTMSDAQHDAYLRLLGEVEARNSVYRRHLAMAGRRGSFPGDTEDVPAAEQFRGADLVRLTTKNSALIDQAVKEAFDLKGAGYEDVYGDKVVKKHYSVDISKIEGRRSNTTESLDFSPEDIAEKIKLFGTRALRDILEPKIAGFENGVKFELDRVQYADTPQRADDLRGFAEQNRRMAGWLRQTVDMLDKIERAHPEFEEKQGYDVRRLDPEGLVEPYSGRRYTEAEYDDLKGKVSNAILALEERGEITPDQAYAFGYDFDAQGFGGEHGSDGWHPEEFAKLYAADKDLVDEYNAARAYLEYAGSKLNAGLSWSTGFAPGGRPARLPSGLYSAVERVIEGEKTASAAPAQWMAMLRNKPGVKPEEMRWLGLNDWLQQQEGPVSKQAVLDYVRANSIEINEVMKGGPGKGPQLSTDIDDWVMGESQDIGHGMTTTPLTFPGIAENGTGIDIVHMANGEVESYTAFYRGTALADWDNFASAVHDLSGHMSETGVMPGGVKFAGYKLPGGTNYREALLTLPQKPMEPVGDRYYAKQDGDSDNWNVFDRETGEPTHYGTMDHNRDWAEQVARSLNTPPGPPAFTQSHWSEPNVVAHVRFDDRVGANGEKILHVAEVQSDWHEKGRKGGYIASEAIKQAEEDNRQLTELRPKINDMLKRQNLLGFDGIGQARNAISHDPPSNWGEFDNPEDAQLAQEYHDLYQRAIKSAEAARGAVPDAPFKSTWPALILKRMLRYAAENGYDRLTWDTGDTNAERFGLSHHISKVRFFGLRREHGGSIQAFDHSGRKIFDRPARPEELPDIIGKETADKLMAAPEGADSNNLVLSKELSGLDLKVGGEGQRGFYDDMLPAMANKLVRPFGGKVERGELLGAAESTVDNLRRSGQEASIEHAEDGRLTVRDTATNRVLGEFPADQYDEAVELANRHRVPPVPVHSIDITPSMRAGIMQKGFPVFLGAPKAPPRPETVPIPYDRLDPHVRKQVADVENFIRNLIHRQTGRTVKVEFKRDIRLTGSTGYGGAKLSRASGTYTPLENVIRIAMNHSDPAWYIQAVHHEAWHAIEDLLLDDRELALLERNERNLRNVVAMNPALAKYAETAAPYEIRAMAYQTYAGARAKQSGTGTESGLHIGIRQIFERIMRFFRDVAAYVRRMFKGDMPSDIFERAFRGEMANRVTRAERGLGSRIQDAADAAMAKEVALPARTEGLPPKMERPIASFDNAEPLKAHPDYTAAKAGDTPAALRFVRDMVKPDTLDEAARKFGPDVTYAPVLSEEATGPNRIPRALAELYAAHTGASTARGITQVTKAYHTGASAIERLLVRPKFAGPVEPGRRYVLVDDVTVMGSTLSELANHIHQNGGEVAGVVTLVNAARTGVLNAKPAQIREITRRFGNAIEDLFGIAPEALNGPEATYVLNFRNVDALRAKAASGWRQRGERLASKGIAEPVEPTSVAAPPPPGGPPPGGAPAAPPPPSINARIRNSIADLMASDRGTSAIENFSNLSHRVRILQNEVEARFTGEVPVGSNSGLPIIREPVNTVLPDERQFYGKKRLHPGKVAYEVGRFYKQHVDPLRNYMRENEISLKDAGDYLYARHAEERNREVAQLHPAGHPFVEAMSNPDIVGGSGMSANQAREIIDRLEHGPNGAAYAGLVDRIRAIRDFNLDTLVRYGLESHATVTAWKARYDDYVPLRGWEEAPEDAPPNYGVGGQFNVRGKETQEALGRRSKADNPLVNLLDQSMRFIDRGERNVYLRSLATALHGLDPADLAGIASMNRGRMKRARDPNTGLVTMVSDFADRYRPEAVHYKIGGESRYIVFKDVKLAEAIKRMNPYTNRVISFLLKWTNKLKALWTHYSPEFMLRHFGSRYPIEGLLNAQEFRETGDFKSSTYLKEAFPIWGKGMRAILAVEGGRHTPGDELQDFWQEMKKEGGAIMFRQMRDVELLREHLETALRDLTGRPDLSFRQRWRHTVERLDYFTNAMDNALRLSAYAIARRQGMSPQKAALRARDATIDYQLRANFSKSLGVFLPFYNTAMRTGTRLSSAAIRSRYIRRAFLGVIAASAVAALWNYLVGGNDTDGTPVFEKIAPWDRQLNFNILNPFDKDAKGRPQPIKIPLPYNWALPMNMGNIIVGSFFGKEGFVKRAESLMKSTIMAFTPLGEGGNILDYFTPEVARPAAHVIENKTWTGARLHEDERFQKGPNAYSGFRPIQGYERTGEGWKRIAEFVNDLPVISGGDPHHSGYLDFHPEDYREFFDQFFGAQRRFGLELRHTGESIAKGEMPKASDIPMLRVLRGADYDAADRAEAGRKRYLSEHPWLR